MFLTSPKIGTHLLRQSLPESLGGERSLLSATAFQLCCFIFATKDKRENDILFGKNSDEGKGIFLSSCKPWRAFVKPHICNHFSSCRISSFNPPRFPSSRKLPRLTIPHFFSLMTHVNCELKPQSPVWKVVLSQRLVSMERREKACFVQAACMQRARGPWGGPDAGIC